jgi:serine/threonine protein phosphatase PrpC
MLAQMDCFGLTDVGRKRPTNQDHFLIADLNKSLRVHSSSLNLNDGARIYGGSQGKLLIVADGMGGEAAGERASTIAMDQLATYVLNSLSWCFRLEADSEQDFQDHLQEALQSCQNSIETAVAQHPEMRGMGTTLTMAYIVWPRAFVVHVGDSRCYLLKDRRLEQITRDHTVGSVLARVNEVDDRQARKYSMGHALLNALGGRSSDLSVDVYKLTLDRGDVLLLCTDGLYDMLAQESVAEVVNSAVNAETACRKLVDLANENGGKDNITVIVAKCLSPQRDGTRAFVEVEVPLDEITALSAESTKSTVQFKPLN